ncbi:acetyl-CoA carboxylase-like isoform X2 [Gordionus sp. m RMFG-2023]
MAALNGLDTSISNSNSHKFGSLTLTNPEEFVIRFGGTTLIKKILIANNGIAAVKCMRSIRRWSYEMFRNERAIKFVVMVTPEDLKANAEYIKMADQYIPVPGGPNHHNYANVPLIVEVCARAGADAVWAGWGHASENPALPTALVQLGVAYLGPPAYAMKALGDKIASTVVAQSAKVPTLAWSGSGIIIENLETACLESNRHMENTAEEDENASCNLIPQELYDRACIHSLEQGLEASKRITYPVMIKASEGGGGKGIRKVVCEEEFPMAFKQVQTEVPSSPIFLMKAASKCRHLEVQLLADVYGNAISLFGRDCSIQRRHQKIMEEAPVTIAASAILNEMEKSAVRLAKMVGYVSAGTVEYLYDPLTQEFSFLELNPRLQVEHPCTEMICDINLPACQLQIAMGLPLNRIKDIRLFYGLNPWEDGPLPLLFNDAPSDQVTGERATKKRGEPRPRGHVIACRITSENPDEGFKPSSGQIQELNFRSNKNIWGYFSVAASGGLHEFADSQFGHCFSWGETRDEARQNLVVGLKELSIMGDFRTTVEYLITLLETESFQKNIFDTEWLDKLISEKFQSEKPDTMMGVICASIHVADQTVSLSLQKFKNALSKGQILPANSLTHTVTVDLVRDMVKYSVQVTKTGPNTYFLLMNGSYIEIEAHRLSDGSLLFSLYNQSFNSYIKEESGGRKYRVVLGNKTCCFDRDAADPTALRAVSPGKLLEYCVEDGSFVTIGQVFAQIEVMKMVVSLKVEESGILRYVKRPGAILETGTLIARIEISDPKKIKRASKYLGTFAQVTPPIAPAPAFQNVLGRRTSSIDFRKSSLEFPNIAVDTETVGGNVGEERLNRIFEGLKSKLENMLNGYDLPEPYFTLKLESTVDAFMKCLRDPKLPQLELEEIISSLNGRIPAELLSHIVRFKVSYGSNITSMLCQFPSQGIARVIDEYAARCLEKRSARDAFFATVAPLVRLIQRYRNGIRGHMKLMVQNLLKQYLNVETYFQNGSYDKCGAKLRETLYKEDPDMALSCFTAHAQCEKTTLIALALIDHLCRYEPGLTDELNIIFGHLANLSQAVNGKVALRARQVLIASHQPSYELRHNQVESIFLSSIDMYGHEFCPENLQRLIFSETAIFDVLPDFFFHKNKIVRQASLEVYIRRAYIAYQLHCLMHYELNDDICVVEFQFILPSSHPNRAMVPARQQERRMSRINGENISVYAQRMGAMAAFTSFEQFEKYFPLILEKVSIMDAHIPRLIDPDTGSFSQEQPSQSEEPILILNAAISLTPVSSTPGLSSSTKTNVPSVHMECAASLTSRIRPSLREDDAIALKFERFCQSQRDVLKAKGIRRLTFLIVTGLVGITPTTQEARDNKVNHQMFPKYFTYRLRDDFKEDRVYRYLEPALAFQLEINRMRTFDLETIPTANYKMHMYLGRAKVAKGREVNDYRFFVRAIVRHCDLVSKEASFEYLQNEGERILLEAMDELELISWHPDAKKADCNHIFLNFVPTVVMDPIKIEESVRGIVDRYGHRLWKLRVLQAEIKVAVRLTSVSKPLSLRIFVTNENGYYVDISTYQEVTDPTTGQIKFEAYGPVKKGPLHGHLLSSPYMTKDHLQHKRFQAQSNATTYVYDFPDFFKQNLIDNWKRFLADLKIIRVRNGAKTKESESKELLVPSFEEIVMPERVASFTELVLDTNDELVECERLPGGNDIGMVAWKTTLYTPEYPKGRDIIVIANDITFKIGSFGTREDLLYYKASELAMKLKIPRLYISSNSGARIGIDEALKNKFKVAWEDERDPNKGFKYLYLSPEDYEKAKNNNSIIAQPVKVPLKPIYCNGDVTAKNDIRHDTSDNKRTAEELRYKIDCIIGTQPDLGVENLKGSAMIAGCTSRAYRTIPTYGIVTCRSIGIGAYLIRLGQRVAQVENSHVILTGSAALNKLLGREVYTSNSQLGGLQITHNNGVAHASCTNDLSAVALFLNWISFVPKVTGENLPITPLYLLKDPVDRPIGFTPTNSPYDPRWMLSGKDIGAIGRAHSLDSSVSPSTNGNTPNSPGLNAPAEQDQLRGSNKFLTGIMDMGSFDEIMKPWAPTVICGRARLGGIPLGVIAVETRTVEIDIPADPANLDSEAKKISQAGQVWFPDSAYKTSQAIKDFDREGLPLMIFANWRGFSGGMKDMFDQVLKFGAYIVDALEQYSQPVIIYLPPYSELRGGAWVVLDPAINPAHMEMYADKDSR